MKISFNDAEVSTSAKKYSSRLVFHFLLPAWPPKNPPKTAKVTISKAMGSRDTPVLHCPKSPEKELTQINKAETAAASFILPQFNNKITGERIIPPPIPMSPEKNPIPIPMHNAKIGFAEWDTSEESVFLKKILPMAKNSKKPSIFLYKNGSMVQSPPKKEAG